MNRSKVKGTRFESEVVEYLRQRGFDKAERRALSGILDRGDIANVPGWVLECKAEAAITLSSYVEEALREMENAKEPYAAAIVKRRGKNVRDAYAVMPLWLFSEILKRVS